MAISTASSGRPARANALDIPNMVLNPKGSSGLSLIVFSKRSRTASDIEDFLRKVWKERIEFVKLNIANPVPLPIGPTTVIGDNVGFMRAI